MRARTVYLWLACLSFVPAFAGLYLSTRSPWTWLTAFGYGLAITSCVTNYYAHGEPKSGRSR